MIGNLLLFVGWSTVLWWFADWVATERCERRWHESTQMIESARRHADWQPFDQDAV